MPKLDYYIYADYASWELAEGERFELIDGVPYSMAAPSVVHQEVSGELFVQLSNFLKGKPCKAFTAPFDVCLHAEGDMDDTVVQPDIIVVCDKTKLSDKKRCNGVPDLVIEILSSSYSARRRDNRLKYQKYEFAGVREYWMVDPDELVAEVCVLVNGKYKTTQYKHNQFDTEPLIIPVSVLDGCEINMKEVFSVDWK